MKKIILCMMLGLLHTAAGHGKGLKVFQINIWQETTMVKGGFDGLVNQIVNLDPDIVMLCEVRNFENVPFVPKLVKALRNKGKTYYGKHTPKVDVAVLSKYKILEQRRNCPNASDAGSVLKARIDVDGREVVVYSAHLDYTHYACYLPRGYDGVTWKNLPTPITDKTTIEKMNNESMRDEAIRHVTEDAMKEHGNIILLGATSTSRRIWTGARRKKIFGIIEERL